MRVFNSHQALLYHTKSKHVGVKYACNQCDQQFTYEGYILVLVPGGGKLLSYPKVTYSCPKVTQSYPRVTYSGPKVTYSDPKVTYNYPRQQGDLQ